MSEGETRTKKEKPYYLPPVIALVTFLMLVYFYMNPELLPRSALGLEFDDWMNIGYLIIIVMLCISFIWKITLSTPVGAAVEPKVKGETEEAAGSGEPKVKKAPKARPKRVVKAKAPPKVEVDEEEAEPLDEDIPEGLHRPHGEIIDDDIEDIPRVIEYEKKEPGGVYSDTLIRVDKGLVLNLRTILGKVCHNCEELEDCKRRVAGKLDDDVFLFNFECKDGLKRELHKARKKRQAEAKKAKAAKEMVKGKSTKSTEKPKATGGKKKKAPAKTSKKKTTKAKK
jgi:hypothetical protein